VEKKLWGGSDFAISFSSMIYLLSEEVMKNQEFAWIREISSTPYYSAIHPLNKFMAKDRIINDRALMMGYNYSSRLLKSGVLLAKIIKESGILPKNFSVLPMIEQSFKSGSREYCGGVKDLKDLLVVEKLHSKKLRVPKEFFKYCFDVEKLKAPRDRVFDPLSGGRKKVSL
jgi:hypothetical protein